MKEKRIRVYLEGSPLSARGDLRRWMEDARASMLCYQWGMGGPLSHDAREIQLQLSLCLSVCLSVFLHTFFKAMMNRLRYRFMATYIHITRALNLDRVAAFWAWDM